MRTRRSGRSSKRATGDGLKPLIGERNAAYGTWGFKLPMLCQWLDHDDMALFNDPHVIVTFRDPVAIAVRASLSEYQEQMQALRRRPTTGGDGGVRRAARLPQAVAEL